MKFVRMPVIRLVYQQGRDEFGQDSCDQIGLSTGWRWSWSGCLSPDWSISGVEMYLVRMPVARLVYQQGRDEFGQDSCYQIGLSTGRRWIWSGCLSPDWSICRVEINLVRMPVIRLVYQQGGGEFCQDACHQIGLSAGWRWIWSGCLSPDWSISRVEMNLVRMPLIRLVYLQGGDEFGQDACHLIGLSAR